MQQMARAAVHQMVDAVVDEALEAGRVVGAVVLVRDRGVPVYLRAAGYADREAGIPMALDTVFRWASLTKPVVAATALALAEHGRLDLDDPVGRFLPEFTPRLPNGSAPRVSVRHLLTHTGGLAYPASTDDDPYFAARVSDGLDQPGLSMQENLRRIASAPLYFPPGSAWRYSVATDVLGAAIAVVHGEHLADAVATYITDPLGMRDSGFVVREPARLAVPYADGKPQAVRMGEPHRVEDLIFSPARAFDERSFQSGGAGMVGSAEDFMIFLETLRSGGGPILTGETVELASRNQVGALRKQEAPGWGFGFLSAVLIDPERAGSPAAAGALAWGGVYGSSWFLDPTTGLSVVALTNTALEGCSGSFPASIQKAIYAARGTAVSLASRPADPSAKRGLIGDAE